MDLFLKCGRYIKLGLLRQTRTYGGLLAGYPYKRMNDRMIERTLSEASRIALRGGKALLLAPAIRSNLANQDGVLGPEESLPKITTIARFDSDGLTGTDSEQYSSLTVVWFQDEFGVPTDPRILEQLRAIDWNRAAQDWTP